MAPISNASRLAEFGSGIGTDGAVIQVDNINKRVGIGTTNPQGMLQVGQGVTVYGSTGIVSATEYWGDGSNLDGLVSAAVTQYIAADSITSSGIVTITNTTDATSTTTGALIISGGVGIAKSLHVGQNITIGGTLTYEDVTNVDSIGVVTARSGVNVSGGQFLVGSGVTIGNAGVATFSGTGDIHLLDNVRLNVGDGSDLAIYHNGSHNFINASNGNLNIISDLTQLQTTGGETAMKATANGAVELRYNDSAKFVTTNDGTVTTGIATASGARFLDDGLDTPIVSIFADDTNPYALHIGNSTYNTGASIGQNWFNNDSGEGYFRHIGNSAYLDYHFSLHNGSTNKMCLKFESDDQSVLLYNGGSEKFRTTNDGTVTTGIVTATKLILNESGAFNDADEYLLVKNTDGACNLSIVANNTDHSSLNMGDEDDFNVGKIRYQHTDNAMCFFTSDTEKARISGVGSFGLGTATPKSIMEIVGANPVLTIRDTETSQGSANARLRLAETGSSDALDNYWDVAIDGQELKIIEGNLATSTADTRLTISTAGEATFASTVSDSKGDLRRIIYENKTGSHTLVVGDAGKAIHISTGGVTIDNSIFSAGDAVTIVNNSGSSQTITQGSGVTLYNTDDASTGNKTLKARGIATVWFSSASIGYITGNFE